MEGKENEIVPKKSCPQACPALPKQTPVFVDAHDKRRAIPRSNHSIGLVPRNHY